MTNMDSLSTGMLTGKRGMDLLLTSADELSFKLLLKELFLLSFTAPDLSIVLGLSCVPEKCQENIDPRDELIPRGDLNAGRALYTV